MSKSENELSQPPRSGSQFRLEIDAPHSKHNEAPSARQRHGRRRRERAWPGQLE